MDGIAAVADLGGSIITGIDGNPLAVLAKQLSIPLYHINSNDVPLYLEDGSEPPKQVDDEVQAFFDSLLDRSYKLRDELGDASASISVQDALDALWKLHRKRKQREKHKQQQQQQSTEKPEPQHSQPAAKQAATQAEHQPTTVERLPGSYSEQQPVLEQQHHFHQTDQEGQQATTAQQPVTLQQQLPNGQQQQQLQHRQNCDPGNSPAMQQDGLLKQEVAASTQQPDHQQQQGEQQPLASSSLAVSDQQQQQKTTAEASTHCLDSSIQDLQQLLVHWHMANIEFANAAQLSSLSMRHWDLDDPYELQGAHVFLPGGNMRLVAALADGVPVLYNCPAQLVQYSSQGVAVHTQEGLFAADAVVVTVPLGVLKQGKLRFQPPLPARKQAAIERLGYGCLNKIMLLFPYCFWGSLDMFARVAPDPSKRGEFYLFYGYNDLSGGPVLAALVAGDAAIAFESMDKGVAVQSVMEVIRGIYEPQGVQVPAPLQVISS